jgi:hypothetical protein
VLFRSAYVIVSNRMDLALSAGPSFFSVSQDLVSDVVFSETYPYDTATFTSATITKATATKIGFNAGADVGIKLSKNFGVGGLVRYSKASVVLPLANATAGISTDAGGLQAAGGVRFFF